MSDEQHRFDLRHVLGATHGVDLVEMKRLWTVIKARVVLGRQFTLRVDRRGVGIVEDTDETP